jgi:hypothetical protein
MIHDAFVPGIPVLKLLQRDAPFKKGWRLSLFPGIIEARVLGLG